MTVRAADALEAEMDAVLPPPSLRRIALAALLVLGLGVGGLLGWAAVTPLDRAVIAGGALTAETKRKTISLLEPGILRELLVREGEQVVAGQPLLRLDFTQAEAAATQARALVIGQAARAARLRAEQMVRASCSCPRLRWRRRPRIPSSPRWSKPNAGSSPHAGAHSTARSACSAPASPRRRNRLGPSRRSGWRRRRGCAPSARNSWESRNCWRTAMPPAPGMWELQRNEAEMLGNIGQYHGQEAATREAVAQAEAEMANLSLNRQQDVARDLQDAQAQLADAQQRLRGALDLLSRREVIAPEAGTVTDIRFFTPGSSIAAGVPLLDLVPAGDRLVAEARVTLTDIEQVRLGQPARLRLSAYRTQELPLLDGRVIYVSADRQ